jgi:GTP-binding protein HflX
MLDNEYRIPQEAHATLVSMVCPGFVGHDSMEESQRSITELRELLRTLGIKAGDEYIQNRKVIDPASMIGFGKLEEIAVLAKEKGSNLLVFDFEITSSQARKIKEATGLESADRIQIILEIFARHAQTKEAKIQIEILRLQYLLPRLSGFWTHLSRQKGGVGVMGGEGEQQIELDRRLIREKIEFYKKEYEHIERNRTEQKKRRQNKAVMAAIVGYTNAGKSSLMNRLCRVNVLEENKLFATLDSTHRMLNPDTHPPMILIDTVGFISNLPSTLIQGFKTTLESALEADLLIIVCDVSDPHYKKQLEVTMEVLKELKVENKEMLIVFNKRDLLNDVLTEKIIKRNYPNSFCISSLNPDDIKQLRGHIIEYFLSKQTAYDLFVPYEFGEHHSSLRANTNIVQTLTHEKGIYYRVRTQDSIFNTMGLHRYLLAPEDPFIEELKKTSAEIDG